MKLAYARVQNFLAKVAQYFPTVNMIAAYRYNTAMFSRPRLIFRYILRYGFE